MKFCKKELTKVVIGGVVGKSYRMLRNEITLFARISVFITTHPLTLQRLITTYGCVILTLLHLFTYCAYIRIHCTYHATLKEADIQRVSSTHPSLASYCTHYRVAVTTLADHHCPVPSVNDWPLDPTLASEHLRMSLRY